MEPKNKPHLALFDMINNWHLATPSCGSNKYKFEYWFHATGSSVIFLWDGVLILSGKENKEATVSVDLRVCRIR